jgi:hypothetical protein
VKKILSGAKQQLLAGDVSEYTLTDKAVVLCRQNLLKLEKGGWIGSLLNF